MATVNTLEDEISCSVCFEIYQDPHVLRECLHTFCLKCIKKIEQRCQVQCPECREFTNIRDIKKDFKTQRFIDIHQTQQNKSSTGGQPSTQICGMCQNSKQPIKSHCEQCDIYICSVCETGHKKSKALKSHTVKPSKMITQLESICCKTISDLKKEMEDIDKELSNISTNLTDIQQSNARHLADVKTFTQDRIQAMKDQEKTLEKIITDANDKLLKYIKERREILTMQKTEIQSKIDLLEDLIKSQNMATLQETAKSVNQTIQNDISKIQSILSQRSGYISTNVIVKKGSNWDVKGSIEVKLSNMMYANQQIQPVLKSLYSELYTHQYQCNKQVKLDYGPYKLCVIKKQLWCAGSGGLCVYDKDCQLVKQVKHDKISDAVSLTVSETGQIIVACCDNKGLYQLDTSRKYPKQIKQGSFADVVCYNGDIYALEYEQCNITVFKNRNNQWRELTQYELEHSDGSSDDRLSVQNERIYVSTWSSHTVYVYTAQGQFIHQMGEHGRNTPGELCYPTLCDVDSVGNMLIADYCNNRFQVCDSIGDWYVITLPGEVKYPKHAVVGDDGELWVIQWGQYALIKYTMK